MDDTQVKAALTGVAILAPPTSKHPKRALITVGLMECIFGRLDLTDPLDAVVAGHFSTIFHSVACTGKFTLTTLNAFDPLQHVKPSDISNRTDSNNLEVTVFHLPRTKCAPEGEDVFWSHQDGVTDPKTALNNHLQTNNPPVDGPLFAYRHAKGLCLLTKKVFLDRINVITLALGEDSLKGHGIRIGGTL